MGVCKYSKRRLKGQNRQNGLNGLKMSLVYKVYREMPAVIDRKEENTVTRLQVFVQTSKVIFTELPCDRMYL